MNSMRVLTSLGLTAALAACSSGDITLAPTNIDSSVTNGGGGGGTTNPCASYTVAGATRQGAFDGTNCTYDATFASDTSPLTVDLTIPFFSGVHIFQNSLVIGMDVSSGTAPASGTGPTLTVQAGNRIAFTDSGDYLLINRGSRIIADGSATAPITFTGFTDAVSHTAGAYDVQLWGGIVINGNGITNNCTDAQRASNSCHVEAEGRPSFYGGNDNADNSGILRYVVVKHPGFEVAPGDELNGVTFNAVGSGTVVENLEIYSAYDDGVEFFGGAVNISNLVALYVRDDSIDFSDGYIGTINNALVIHPPTDGNRCIEGDNVASTRLAGGGEPNAADGADDPAHDLHPVELRRRHARRLGRPDHPLRRAHDPHRQHHRRRPRDCEACATRRTSASSSTAISTTTRRARPRRREHAEAHGHRLPGSVRFRHRGQPRERRHRPDVDQWRRRGANYPLNTFNVVITDPANVNVQVLQPNTYFSVDLDAAVPTVTIRNAAATNVVIGSAGDPVTDGYIGAVRSTANWAANWTYGLNAGNRGIAPWWE